MASPIQNNKVQQLIQGQVAPPAKPMTGSVGGSAFAELLTDRLKLSGHAQTRLQSRNIELDQSQWDRVMDGVDRAATKGARDSLVLIDNVALVVSVKNRTVITAVDQEQLKENVFTNIDSAVIV